MMMKSRSKYKLHKIIIATVLLLGLLYTFRFSIAKITSPITESIAVMIDRFSASKTTVINENQELKKQLATIMSENQKLILQSQSSEAVGDIFVNNIVGRATISSLPFALTGPINTYGLSNVELSDNAENLLVASNNFLYGVIKSKKTFRPFNNKDQLNAIMQDGQIIAINVKRSFIYQIELPKAIAAPEGLIESSTGKVLGFKVGQTELNPTTNIFTYRLPIMPTLYQSVTLLK